MYMYKYTYTPCTWSCGCCDIHVYMYIQIYNILFGVFVSSEFLVWLVPSLLRVVVYPDCGLLVNDIMECVRKLMEVSCSGNTAGTEQLFG